VNWILKEAERQPVRLDVEDLHWADPSTLEFLTLLLDQAPTARLLVLLTFRPEFRPPWTMRSHMTQVTLRRLAPKQAEVMMQKVIGGQDLPAEVLRQIVAKTDGVPLFVEEMTKTVIESIGAVGSHNHPSLQALIIPTTLHDSLMARLDRLGPAKEVAQLGATLGREFSSELIQAVSSLDEAILQRELARLVDVEILFQRGLPPQTRYVFKHALIQDTAYQSLLKSTRQKYHNQIARVLEERFPETVETQPELLAHHYTEAGLVGQAIPYWQQAGQRVTQRSAHVEAISHFTKGLELLKTLPDTPGRLQQELVLQLALGVPLRATKGIAAPEVERAYTRARELCRQIGETPQLYPVLQGLWGFYLGRAQYQTARELGEQCLTLAQRVQDPALLMPSYNALGETLRLLGEFAPARAYLEQGLTLYDPQQHRSLAFLHGVDPGVDCLSIAAFVLWYLGYPEQALKRSHEALTLAQGLSHPFSLGLALVMAGFLHQLRREGQAEWSGAGSLQRGWVLAEQGQRAEGIAQMRQGLAAFQTIGAEIGRTANLAWLAEAYGQEGQAETGLAVLAEALALVDKNGERIYEAELYRLKGELLLTQEGRRLQAIGYRENTEEAEACFLKAIEIARKQQAKSLELRATMSLARLWQQQGKKKDAHEMLADIYGWFTEGFDTVDLQEARALLAELV
jgi:predicted ATPase